MSGIVPGRYILGNTPFFGVSAASVVWGLESVLVDGNDVTDLPVTITTESVPKEVSVVLSDRWQELSGRLTDAEGKGVSDYTVMVFPVDEAYWVNGSRRIVISQPGTGMARFTIGGPGPAVLPPARVSTPRRSHRRVEGRTVRPGVPTSIVGAAIRISLAPSARHNAGPEGR